MIFQEFKNEAPPPITCFEPSRPAYLERSARKKEFDSKRWKKTVTQKSAAFLVFQRKFNSLNWNPVRFQSWKARVSYVRM